jgi:hypothetical protein
MKGIHTLCAQLIFSPSSDSDDASLSKIVNTAQLELLEELDDDGGDGQDETTAKQGCVRTKNEVVEEMSRINLMEISIGETTLVECLGTVEKVMDSIAIVKAHTGGEYRILDEGTFVFTNTRKVVGMVSALV